MILKPDVCNPKFFDYPLSVSSGLRLLNLFSNLFYPIIQFTILQMWNVNFMNVQFTNTPCLLYVKILAMKENHWNSLLFAEGRGLIHWQISKQKNSLFHDKQFFLKRVRESKRSMSCLHHIDNLCHKKSKHMDRSIKDWIKSFSVNKSILVMLEWKVSKCVYWIKLSSCSIWFYKMRNWTKWQMMTKRGCWHFCLLNTTQNSILC